MDMANLSLREWMVWERDQNKQGELRDTQRLRRLYKNYRASLVAQWLRIRLLMQGTWVQALVWEDPTCHGAAKPMRHNY